MHHRNKIGWRNVEPGVEATSKEVRRTALEVWPDGQDILSMENVINMSSASLFGGLFRWMAAFIIATNRMSRNRAGRERILKL